MRIAIFITAAICLITGSQLRAEPICRATFDHSLSQVLQNNKFEVSRDLVDYLLRFGPRFQVRVRDLLASQTWLDIGAGHALAQRDYVRVRQKEGAISHEFFEKKGNWEMARQILKGRLSFAEKWPLLLSVSYAKPTGFDLSAGNPVKYHEMDWSQSWWKKFASSVRNVDVMTDYYGNLSYTKNISRDLKSYLQLLSPTGALYVSIDKSVTHIQKGDGSTVDLLQWLQTVPGLEVRPIWTKEILDKREQNGEIEIPWDGDSFEIRLKNDFKLSQIPNLQLVEIQVFEAGPPDRLFQEIPGN